MPSAMYSKGQRVEVRRGCDRWHPAWDEWDAGCVEKVEVGEAGVYYWVKLDDDTPTDAARGPFFVPVGSRFHPYLRAELFEPTALRRAAWRSEHGTSVPHLQEELPG